MSSSRLTDSLRQKLRPIKAALFDMEGVLVDSSTINPATGLNTKAVSAPDREAILGAIEAGLTVGIITSRESSTVDDLAEDLHITDVYQGYMNKSSAYEEFKFTYELEDEQIAYMGDDILDLTVIKMVGFSAAPFNAHSSVRIAAHYVCRARGGMGAVSEMMALLSTVQNGSEE